MGQIVIKVKWNLAERSKVSVKSEISSVNILMLFMADFYHFPNNDDGRVG